jgi:taurine dioxygenase
MSLTVKTLSPSLGAEISGIDLSKDLESSRDTLAKLFADHQVLFFRDQDLQPSDLIRFANIFGPVGEYPFAKGMDVEPRVIPIIKEPTQTTNFGGVWHTDSTYLAKPSAASVLYSVEVPEIGGDTMWANAYQAYDALSPGLQKTLANLQVVCSAAKGKAQLRGDHLSAGSMKAANSDDMDIKQATHPVIRTHPATGRKALYLSKAHVTHFEGMSQHESAALLDYLYQHQIREEFTCRFHWTAGTMAIWDNRCTVHYPLNDYHGHRREMWRVTIDGDVPA